MLPCKNAKLKNMLLLHDSSETAQRFFRQGFNLDKQKALEAEQSTKCKEQRQRIVALCEIFYICVYNYQPAVGELLDANSNFGIKYPAVQDGA